MLYYRQMAEFSNIFDFFIDYFQSCCKITTKISAY